MKISGRRADGALYLSMGAGVAVILRGDRVSPPLDEATMDRLGPWKWSPDDATFEARRDVEKRLDRATVSAGVISLGLINMEDKKKDDKAVSDVAETAQGTTDAPPTEVMNLKPTAPMAPDPAEDRKKKRGELRDKIRVGLKSQRKVEDVLSDEDISDDDLYAMAKALGVTYEEIPTAVVLVDNPTKFRRLLASTTLAQHLAEKQEHPFTYCRDTIIPKMVEEGKGPDDPDAFCAFWKAEYGSK